MRFQIPPSLVAGAAALLAAAPALAHDGAHGAGLLAGLAHPLSGVDHLLATVGLGLVAGLASRPGAASPGGPAHDTARRALRGPVGHGGLAAALGVAAGVAAIVWAAGGTATPGVGAVAEIGVAAGLLALALALRAADRIGGRGLPAFAIAVGVPHGLLHAIEGSGAGFFAGLTLASVALFVAGAATGRALAARPQPGAGRTRWALAAGYLGGFAWFAAAALR
jgi:urease accessory protein